MADRRSPSPPPPDEKGLRASSIDVEKRPANEERREGATGPDGAFDAFEYYQSQQGRLVVDPEEAAREFGEKVASTLKLSRDGTKVLWPQPKDDPSDPMNWSDKKKALQLLIITMAAFVPDFDSSIGIASLFALAKEFRTTPGKINNLTSNWSIFLLGWGGIFAVMLMRRLGRLPILFWSQLLALAFMVGATFSPNLRSFAAFRCLAAFFGTCPQVTGLYIVTDMYPFHVQARQLNIWTMGFIASPFVGPFLLGFCVAGTGGWRWAYGIGSLYGLVVLLMIVFLGEETLYDRSMADPPPPRPPGVKGKIEALIGIAGARSPRTRPSWGTVIASPLNVLWRPQLLGVLIFEALLFGFGIGVNVTNTVFLGEPEEAGGFGFSPWGVAAMYATPMVGVIIGEILGHYLNDYIMNWAIRRNHGVFEAENRLWACYLAVPLYVLGFCLLGASLENHMSTAAIIFGWGIAELAIMLNTVAIYAYCNDCFPRHQGEISGLVNLSRTLGGFSVAYFQVPWAEKAGALTAFGTEAAIVVGLFLLAVPAMQWKGRELRARFSIEPGKTTHL